MAPSHANFVPGAFTWGERLRSEFLKRTKPLVCIKGWVTQQRNDGAQSAGVQSGPSNKDLMILLFCI